jgi:hypothetical protein
MRPDWRSDIADSNSPELCSCRNNYMIVLRESSQKTEMLLRDFWVVSMTRIRS